VSGRPAFPTPPQVLLEGRGMTAREWLAAHAPAPDPHQLIAGPYYTVYAVVSTPPLPLSAEQHPAGTCPEYDADVDDHGCAAYRARNEKVRCVIRENQLRAAHALLVAEARWRFAWADAMISETRS